MKFAKRVFLVAGVYGVIVIVPMYFAEGRIGRDHPPAITHPEFYYGFLGVALAWQVVFLVLAQDPSRYRPMVIPSVLEKVSYGPLWLFCFWSTGFHSWCLAWARWTGSLPFSLWRHT